MPTAFYRQLGTSISTITFTVALGVFIYAVASNLVSGLQAWLLFATSFLLMLRFWWRYSELFVQFLPSRTFWHFLFDFAVSFFGILAVLSVNNMQTWALLGVLAMLSSAIRCALSWHAGRDIKQKLRRTFLGAVAMLIIMVIIHALASLISQLSLAAAVFVIVLIFVAYSSQKP
ncbi:MAG: hypothetical protein HY514_00300 [Candidatus Aenigmarchaeota archaeon]|nr:hypothetical protein [Candidatus Aenigmarchaeota archaeon]